MYLRRAREEDVEALLDFTQSSSRNSYTPAFNKQPTAWMNTNWQRHQLKGRIGSGASEYMLCEHESEIVGCVYLAARRGIHGTDGYMGGLFVAPEWRRRGIGDALVNHAEDSARYHKLSRLLAEVPAHHHRTLALFLGRGWENRGYHQERTFTEDIIEELVLDL